MEAKIISISPKRQITIPQKFFTMLGFDTEAECVVKGNELVIRPARVGGGEFDEQILAELIEQGLSGEELLTKFKTERRKVRPAIERIIEDAENAASGKGKYSTYNDIFGEDD